MSKSENTNLKKENPLGSEPVPKLIKNFAIPSIIAMVVGSFYNIVDQLFIGQTVGTLGNAATNVVFPLSTPCVALALLCGIGGASCFNLSMGRGEKEKAGFFIGNSTSMMMLIGIIFFLIVEIFLDPLLIACGSPKGVLPYAKSYMKITAIGFPFFILSIGGGHFFRGDGSPKVAMMCSLSGAIINIILDAIFLIGFNMGMQGAALATIIGQIVSGLIVIFYLKNYKTVKLLKEHFKIKSIYAKEISAIGTASFMNQMAMMVIQVVLNNSLKYYGSLSVYGEAIPLACAGIVMKVAQLFFSVVIGIGQGCQPIESFNYGAKKYDRVKQTYKIANMAAASISIVAFLLFQIFPRQILSMFGEGNEAYYEFGSRYFRIYLFFICINFIQPLTSTLFSSIGKPIKGTFLSLTRQIIFLLPLVIILPRFMGIDGILYAGPIADLTAFCIASVMAFLEFKNMKKLDDI